MSPRKSRLPAAKVKPMTNKYYASLILASVLMAYGCSGERAADVAARVDEPAQGVDEPAQLGRFSIRRQAPPTRPVRGWTLATMRLRPWTPIWRRLEASPPLDSPCRIRAPEIRPLPTLEAPQLANADRMTDGWPAVEEAAPDASPSPDLQPSASPPSATNQPNAAEPPGSSLAPERSGSVRDSRRLVVLARTARQHLTTRLHRFRIFYDVRPAGPTTARLFVRDRHLRRLNPNFLAADRRADWVARAGRPPGGRGTCRQDGGRACYDARRASSGRVRAGCRADRGGTWRQDGKRVCCDAHRASSGRARTGSAEDHRGG